MSDYCTLYLDSAGDCGWCTPFGNSKVEWYVVAGLVLTPKSDHKAQEEIGKILKKYISNITRNQFLPEQYEIHYHDIIFGKNIYSTLDHPQKKNLSDEIFLLINDLKPVLFATAINKKQMKKVYGTNAYDPRSLGLRSTIHRFAMFLERKGMIGSIIVDEEEYKKDKELQMMIHDFRRNGMTIRGSSYQPILENNLRRVLNNIAFTPSHLSGGLQLADVCSRSTWSHFEKSKSDRFTQLNSLWDRNDERCYEPSIVPGKSKWV